MFPINIKEDMPVSQLVIRSVAVRGYLGPLTVWVSKPDRPQGTDTYHYWTEEHFTQIYKKTHEPSRRTYQTLAFDQPIILKPGEERILYVHSTAPHDRAIVYDNSYFPGVERARYEDAFVQIRTGRAHLSPEPFGQTPIWGWGTAWRTHREFVGQLEYGIVYKLWQPERHLDFGRKFQDATHTILACQRREESPVARLPDECIHYIFNMCRWDWFEDDVEEMAYLRRRLNQGDRSFLENRSSSSSSCRVRPKMTAEQRVAATNNNNDRRRFRFGFESLRNALSLTPSS